MARDTIAGYAYQAEILCGGCLIESGIQEGWASLAARDMVTEEVLDQAQHIFGIDRYDEYSYDSDEFPKVVFSVQIEEGEVCANCHAEL